MRASMFMRWAHLQELAPVRDSLYIAYIHRVISGAVQMGRTQIYLTESEQQALRALSRRTGRTQSELIREAVDRFIAQPEKIDRRSLLKQARGMWQSREDLPDLAALRREFDRPTSNSE